MTQKIQVLFVDDEPGLLEVGKIHLEDFGDFQVTTADDAEEALRFLSIFKYDAIIADYAMADMDGIELLVHLRTCGDTTPYIVFTGKGREEVVIEAFNNGADFYIQKGSDPPAQFTELAHKVRYAVSQRRIERELSESLKRTTEILNFLPDATFAIDHGGVVVAWNQAMEEMTGIRKEEMIGKGDHAYTIPLYGDRRKELLDLFDMDDIRVKSNYQSILEKGHIKYAEGYAPALFGGAGAYVMVTASPLFDMEGNTDGGIESIRDITDKKQAQEALQQVQAHLEEQVRERTARLSEVNRDLLNEIAEREQAEERIKSALAEKEILLREIHHRVKNNLSSIISLIDLQLASLTNPGHIALLQDLETRIRSMVLVHEMLYQTTDLGLVNAAAYAENLTQYLLQTYGITGDVECIIAMDDVTLPIDTAIPCGLVISEIVTNSLKYAFPDSFSCHELRKGPCTISLTLKYDDTGYLLIASDNGIGIPDDIDIATSGTLGTFLIRFITKHQLRGTIEVSSIRGTSYTIRFPKPIHLERKTHG